MQGAVDCRGFEVVVLEGSRSGELQRWLWRHSRSSFILCGNTNSSLCLVFINITLGAGHPIS